MKRFAKIVLGLVVVLVLLVVAVFFWLDPNVFKPRIEAVARDKGVALNINGDLGWQFWPSIGLEINDITVAPLSDPDNTLAQLERASLLVATRPLLSGELMVEHLLVSGAKANLAVDREGRGNWEALIPESAKGQALTQEQVEALAREKAREAEAVEAAEPAPSGDGGQELTLAIDRISVTDSRVNYLDETSGQRFNAGIESLELTGFNFDNRPFELRLEAVAGAEGAPGLPASFSAEFALSAQMQVDALIDRFSLADGTFTAQLDSDNASAEVTADFNVELTGLQSEPSYSGRLELSPVNLKKVLASLGQPVPETAEPDAMTDFNLATDIAGSANDIALAPLTVKLDETTFKGELKVTDISRLAIVLRLAGDKINLDHYLPPPPPEGEAPEPEAAPNTPEQPIALEPIRALNAQVQLDLQRAIVKQLTLKNLRLRAQAKNGLVELTELSLDGYEGEMMADARLDARGSELEVDFNAAMAGLQLAPVLKDMELDEQVQLTGALNFEAEGATRGLLPSQLNQNLSADAQFNGAEVKFAPLNVEKYFCKVVELARDEAEPAEGEEQQPERQWPEFTQMQALEGRVTLHDQKLTVENFSAGVEHLLMATQGSVNLGEQSYDFRLPMTLLEKSTSEAGCAVKSNYWLNRSLSLLRCKGSLTNLSPLKDCGLDNKALESLVGDYAQYRLQKELVKQLGGDSAEGKDKDDTTRAVEGLLNRLLKKDEE